MKKRLPQIHSRSEPVVTLGTTEKVVLGPGEYAFDRKTGTVKFLQSVIGPVSVAFDCQLIRAPRRQAQWKRELLKPMQPNATISGPRSGSVA